MNRARWVWLAVAVAAIVLAFVAYTAAAQTERATALIEQSLALPGDVASGRSLYERSAESDRTALEMHRVVALKEFVGPQAIRDLATYLAQLPPNPRPEFGDGKALAAGKRYYDGLCAFCHGRSAEGNEQHATPSLQHQHYSYVSRLPAKDPL
jgi:cytochrome c553